MTTWAQQLTATPGKKAVGLLTTADNVQLGLTPLGYGFMQTMLTESPNSDRSFTLKPGLTEPWHHQY